MMIAVINNIQQPTVSTVAIIKVHQSLIKHHTTYSYQQLLVIFIHSYPFLSF
jgi:hypothetical protein